MRSPILVVLVLLFARLGAATEAVVPLTPPELANMYPNGISEKPAMFGIPSYTASIIGLLVYATPGDLDGCSPLTRNASWPIDPVIVMVDRGNCTFVTKVRNVEDVRGSAAIIVDNVDETTLPYMADDGTGANIHIPSVLIHKADGQNLKDALRQYGSVLMKMTWNLPHPDNHVEWEFWTSSEDPASNEFKSVFKDAMVSLGDTTLMIPHYYILSGSSSGCVTTTSSLPCGNQCTNHGRYCSVDPEHDTSQGLSGEDIVREDLRQICLWKYLNQTGQQLKWWDYAVAFEDQCAQSDATWTADCSNNILTSLGLNPDTAINNCVTSSGGTGNTAGANSLLDAELSLKSQEGIFYLPTLIINGSPYRGSMNCPTPIDIATCGPLDAICAGFADGTKPPACQSSPGCPLGVQRDPCGICGGDGRVDQCGLCWSPTNDMFNKTCLDCFGVPNGPSEYDACGVCGGTGTFDVCGACFQAGDPARIDPGQGGIDVCGNCLRFTAPNFNKSGCLGCDGKPHSNLKNDACGVCGGDGTFDACGKCFPADSPKRHDSSSDCGDGGTHMSVGAIIGIVAVSVVVVGVAVFCYMKRQQTKMREDIDSLLKQYLPLEAANDMAHRGQPQDQQRLVSTDSSVNAREAADSSNL